MTPESPSIFASLAALLFAAAGLSFMLQMKAVASRLMLVAIGVLVAPAILGSLVDAVGDQSHGVGVRLLFILMAPIVLVILGLLLIQGLTGAIFGKTASAVTVGTLIADLIRGGVRLLVLIPVGLIRLIRRGFDK